MLNTLPTWLRAAIITSGQAAAASILIALVDLLFDLQDWVSDPTNPVDVSGFGKLVIGAVITAATFIVTAVFRKIKPPDNSYQPPQ